MKDSIVIIILLMFNVLFLIVGYILGKVTKNHGVYNTRPKSFFDSNHEDNVSNKILIDNTKVVTDIKTDSLEKKYDQLGTKVQSTENISSAIDKLKNMKG